MIDQWRLFLAALRFVLQGSLSARTIDDAPPHEATRYIPIVGTLVGAGGAVVYWLSAELWPTSIAVILSMLATATLTGEIRRHRGGALQHVFVVLIKYNALMALSAANLPFPLPTGIVLGLIMLAGHAASRALVVSVMATHAPFSTRVSSNDLSIALIFGFAPAVILRVPGLVGLVCAILLRQLVAVYLVPRLRLAFREHLEITQQLTEVAFYLGALAVWRYI